MLMSETQCQPTFGEVYMGHTEWIFYSRKSTKFAKNELKTAFCVTFAQLSDQNFSPHFQNVTNKTTLYLVKSNEKIWRT
jgi:hypothetical protein